MNPRGFRPSKPQGLFAQREQDIRRQNYGRLYTLRRKVNFHSCSRRFLCAPFNDSGVPKVDAGPQGGGGREVSLKITIKAVDMWDCDRARGWRTEMHKGDPEIGHGWEEMYAYENAIVI